MKRIQTLQRVFFIVGAFTVFSSSKIIRTSNHFGSGDDVIYKCNSVQDLSFEGRFTSHNPEMISLNNLYTNYSTRKQVVNIYNVLLESLLKDAIEQTDFMRERNIDLDDLRMRSSELYDLSVERKIRYKKDLELVSSKFAITEKEVRKVDDLIAMVSKDVSFNLMESLKAYQQYMHLAEKIGYTKMEMLEDATGFQDAALFIKNTVSPLDFNRPNQGLASSEAIRKLQGFGDAIMGSYSVYPNPFSNTVTFKFIVSTGDVLECTIYDLNGKKVKALVNTLVISPYSELVWDGSDDDGNKLPSGIYLSSVRTSEGIQTLKIVKQ